MRRMDPLDSSSGKVLFKKRTHRPWNSTLLGSSLEENSPAIPSKETLPTASGAEPVLEPTCPRVELQQLLDERNKERSALELISAPPENRILIGGFLFPQNNYATPNKENFRNDNNLLNELNSKEQEILSLANDLKAEKADELAKQFEMSRKKEEEARKEAENKALFAIQQAKQAAEQAYKAEQQLILEKQLRIESEKLAKSLEIKFQSAINMLEAKEKIVQKESQARFLAEEKAKQLLDQASLYQQKIQKETEFKIDEKEKSIHNEINVVRLEAEQKIKRAEIQANEKIRQSQQGINDAIQKVKVQSEQQILQIQAEANQRVHHIQEEADRKVKEVKDQAFHHEKGKQVAQGWVQKHLEAAQQSEEKRKEIELKLNSITKKLNDERIDFESRTKVLLEEIHQAEAKKNGIENERNLFESQISASLATVRRMEIIVAHERNLRKVLDAKLNATPLRDEEFKRKRVEDKILQLANRIAATDIEKSKLEEALAEANENVNKQEILINSEKTIKEHLENQIKDLTARIYQLEDSRQQESDKKTLAEQKITALLKDQKQLEHEHANKITILTGQQHRIEEEKLNKENEIKKFIDKMHQLDNLRQMETDAKHSAEQKVSMLLNEKQHLEHEKVQKEEQFNTVLQKAKDLELMLEAEKYLRKEAERLKLLEEQAKKAAQEKISHAIAQANRTVLNALGGLSTTDLLGPAKDDT